MEIARSVFVPGLTFWGGTLLRDKLNWPRPYEQPGFEPLVHKETHGHSFPSRHALSAAVLSSFSFGLPVAVPLPVVVVVSLPGVTVGWVMVGITALICLMRVLTGVHYPRDVLCGAALGFALGYTGMWLL